MQSCHADPAPAPATGRPGLLLRDCLAGLALSVLLPLAAVLVSFQYAAEELRGPLVVAGSLLQWLGLAGYPLWVARRRGGARAALALHGSARDVSLGIGAGLIAVVLAGVVVAVQQPVVPVETPTAYGGVLDVAGVWGVVLVVLFATVAPVAEEIHFRGGWYGALRRRGWGAPVTVVVTAVLFALVHLEPTRILVLLVPGLLLGWLRARTRRLAAPVAAHMLVNSLAGVALLTTG